MMLTDTNLLGAFARVDARDLLFDVFSHDEIGVTPALYAEVLAGVHEAHRFR